ncbi:TonB-dependent siderophore receptor [Puteibacter caeruleilacunae]|nr:TonB-dependent siderophore receptor [Puteibacter caeruleilacunae]
MHFLTLNYFIMKKNVILGLLILIGCPIFSLAQKANLTGVVIDKDSGFAISGANIVIDKAGNGTLSDVEGSFNFSQLEMGKHVLTISYVGYEKQRKSIDLQGGEVSVEIKLQKSITMLGDVDISRDVSREAESILKIPALMKDIPMTTSKVDNDLLEQTQTGHIGGALKYTTGVKPMVNYGGFQTFTMRGFGAPVIMLDGARDERMNFSNSAPLTSLASVERIEYLKGPASVLYGHSAVGGIINVVRKQPSNEFKGKASVTYGSWETKKTAIGFGNKINDKLCYRLDVSTSDTKGWRDAADKTLNGYLALNYELNDNNIFEFRLGGNDDTYGTETGLPAVKSNIYLKNGKEVYEAGELPTTFKLDQRYNDPGDFLDHENINTSLKYIHLFSENSKLQVHATYTDDLIDYFSTEELSYLTSNDPIYDTYYRKGEDKVYICLDTLQRTFPLRFSHETKSFQNYIDYSTQFELGSTKHKVNAGHYFANIDRTSFKGYKVGTDVTGDGLFAKISVVDPVLNQGALQTKFSATSIYDERVHGLYLQDLVEVSEKINLMGAVRYDHFRMEYKKSGISTGRHKTNIEPQGKIKNKAWTYRFGAVYKPIEDLSVYASYANFFKPKRSVYNSTYIYLNSNGNEFQPADGKEVFKPEDGYQLESGFKYDLNSKLQVNGSVYYIKKNNIVEYLGESDDDRRIYAQVGVVDSKGFDLDVNYHPLKTLSILAGYSYNEAKYKEFSSNDYTNSKEGNDMRNNPKNQFFSWAYYTVPKGVFQNVDLGFGANYTDKLFTNSSNSYELPSYWMFDAAIGYKKDKVYTKLKVNNILDKDHFVSSVYSSQYIPGRERNFLLTVGLKF